MSVTLRLAEIEFAPKYFVSEDGRVFRELKRSDDTRGYARVDIPHAGKAHYSVKISRLVAGMFLPDPTPEQTVVRHLDGNPGNDHFSNLAWGTPKDNSDDRSRHGTTARGEQHGMAKLNNPNVLEIRKLYKQGWSQRGLARKFGVDRRSIYRVISGKTWTDPELFEDVAA